MFSLVSYWRRSIRLATLWKEKRGRVKPHTAAQTPAPQHPEVGGDTGTVLLPAPVAPSGESLGWRRWPSCQGRAGGCEGTRQDGGEPCVMVVVEENHS